MYKSLDRDSIKVMRINAIISGIILFIICTILFLIFKDENQTVKVIALIVYILIIINIVLNITLYTNIRYKRYKYMVTDEKIEVIKGLFQLQRTIILIGRVQKIDEFHGPIDRKFNLANVSIQTAAGVAEIKFLKDEEAEDIINRVNKILKQKLENKHEN